ncbi:DUF11 domain-containing protein [Bythopirellula polymerisocia]|uniref:Serine-aspartate repeat-containing protein I n=1 Tax=Bythopirellula polymerisocia TaxID=2528003 RepID=A0A5C6CXX8_9BACT|nr:SdrD B-like domain-containing protein [Bythopirellula polymerisocia]TWU28341.1 Serine-aspartate repeat-containing protein I precursor [Bythopirellula polymerisocia]
MAVNGPESSKFSFRTRLFGRKNQHRSLQRSQLKFETLEARQMLAADMAEIIGTVRTDLQGDGNSANDVVVAGAGVTLYRDNGNGTFDASDVQVASKQTNSLGQYDFIGIEAGTYFVKVALPSELQFKPGTDTQKVVISLAEAEGVVGPKIDDFETTQIVTASPPLPASQNSTKIDSGVLGGERDMYVELTSGTDPFSSVSLTSAVGLLRLASDSIVTGNAKIVWDGIDGNAQNINATGLGGVDLTEFNGNTMTGIALTSGADHPNAKIKLRIYSDANNWSEFITTVPESPGGAATGQAVFRFNDDLIAKGGNGADFSNVGALELTFEGVSAVDGQVSLVGLVGRTTKRVNFTSSPRLSIGDRVWADIDDNGLLDAGEKGIAGVKLNLYEDTNGDNSYTSGVDALMGMTTTDSNGNYLFSDLLPGKYIAQVDPTNFLTGGKLSGLVSSLGNTLAADPDNDVNNDDNGSPLAGAGVVSQAITLAGATEPTNDGDANSNSNLTVDFGFFGFDLALDKSVQQTSIAPKETLSYSVKIDNMGPSAAAGTTFKDTLPSFATFVSGTVSIPGVTLQHSGGVVTADLGTMQPGATVIITVQALVSDDATGTLVNTATVSAPKEVNLSNNTDSVSNPVTPRIDLAITKIDSRDPVEPGSTFTYTLEIKNNGPSNATGVIVTDTLPATGVTFVSASQTPSSINGRDIEFAIGDLARGATRTITIDVSVNQGFVGTLLNVAHVEGNEQEITLVNNDDDETTLVKVNPASLAGTVYADKNDNGVYDSGERPISNVLLTLKGTDITGASVNRTTRTASNGTYLFDNLVPGTYRVIESQPSSYKDGKDSIGTHGGYLGEQPGPFVIPNDVTADEVKDLVLGVELAGGQNATKYDFGELAVSISKRRFLAR